MELRQWLVVAALGASAAVPGVAAGQSTELQIRADKGGYLAGDAATVTVSGLTECANRTVAVGFRGAARGTRFAVAETTLDASGGGSVRVPLMTDNGGSPVQPAVWADCVDRGFEPGLALDPHPTLISVSYAGQSELVAFVPPGAAQIAQAVARGDIEAIVAALAPDEVIRTAYPGDGGPVPPATAAGELRARLAPGGSGSDVYGTGRLGLLGAWEINGRFALLASTVRPDGQRHIEALGVGERDGAWHITSYGSVVASTGILELYALQHRVALGSIGPLPPATGDSAVAPPAYGQARTAAVAGLALCLGLAAALGIGQLRPHPGRTSTPLDVNDT